MSAQRVAWWASGQVSMRGDFCRIDGVTAREVRRIGGGDVEFTATVKRRRASASGGDAASHYSRRANGEADGDAGGSRFGFPSLAMAMLWDVDDVSTSGGKSWSFGRALSSGASRRLRESLGCESHG